MIAYEEYFTRFGTLGETINDFLYNYNGYGRIKKFQYDKESQAYEVDWTAELQSYMTQSRYKNLDDEEQRVLQSVCRSLNIQPPENLTDQEKAHWYVF